ncbi:MAG: hypothetical protein MUO42_07140, partial [Anaerolineaceae bacterium]|nr:hypothetical protein [Anaerolineaceae bacterium]
FSNKDAKTGSSQIIDALLDKPVPTLVPVTAGNDNSTASATALREVAQPAPTATLANQTPVIEKVIMGNNSGSSGPSTSTSSSK